MRAMVVATPAPAEQTPLELVERPLPEPAADEVRVAVEACGVCRTDLHVVEGDLPPRRPSVVPGHEVVGRVAACGAAVRNLKEGDRVGVAWLHRSCGRCRFCLRGDENLCLAPLFTGWDVDGGYAEALTVPADFAYRLDGPGGQGEVRSAEELAPLLCAGIIGYRAFARSGIREGGRLGLFGFGGSAHIVLQLAHHAGCETFVFSRGGRHRALAQRMGATWVGASDETPPAPLDAAVLFAPAGELVRPALAALDAGGTLAVAGIHLSEIPPLDYERHLFRERVLRSVTANTREDGRALLALGDTIPITTHHVVYPLEKAADALLDLKHDRIEGAAVLAP